jgi:histidinol phosphatase-like enzyme
MQNINSVDHVWKCDQPQCSDGFYYQDELKKHKKKVGYIWICPHCHQGISTDTIPNSTRKRRVMMAQYMNARRAVPYTATMPV